MLGISDRDASGDCHVRIALLPWMVAGVRTQYENLQLVELPGDLAIDTIPIVPYKTGGTIERLPLLRASHKGTLRSMVEALPLLTRPHHDAVLAQTVLPLLPLIAAGSIRLKAQPAIVFTIDTTPRLMDDFYPIYYNHSPAGPAKRAVRDLLHRHVLRHCAAVLPWSHWAARSFERDYGVPPERIHVMPPGVDLTIWSIPASRAMGIAEERQHPFRLLFVGADFERKGGPLLLDVYRTRLREHCELHLVTKANVEQEHGVHVYRGFGPNEPGLRDLYERCDALVLPTRADCFSLASLEAMACGLPVISCAVGGIPEIIHHGETGFLIPPDDGQALFGAIDMLVSNEPRALSMGLAGRRVVEERFDNSRNSRALFHLLRQVAKEGQEWASRPERR